MPKCGQSMAYAIRITPPAEQDSYSAFERIQHDDPEAAERWLRGLFGAIFSLEDLPARCPLIPEAAYLRREIRHLLYGKKRSIHRIIFDIVDDSPVGPMVRVLRVWHGARNRIRPIDLTER